jgi:hypothetical protein
MVTLSWERRRNGIIPKPSQFTNVTVRDQCPKLLVDFYESRINLKKQSAPMPVPPFVSNAICNEVCEEEGEATPPTPPLLID